MTSALTPEQIAFFHQNGYLKIGKLLDDDHIALLRTEYDREFEAARQNGRFRNLAIDNTDDLDAKKNAETQMLQIMQMCERNLHYRRLLFHEPILDIVETLIGPNIQLFHDQALYKPADNGDAVFWHQDNAYWQCTPSNLISCWLTLDDVTVENGAMHVLPGSHLQALDHERSTSTDALLDLGDQIDDSKVEIIDLPAGGVMFHHCQTLHYTPPNRTDRQRRAFAIHFMPPGTRSQKTGEYLKVSFSRPMLRMHV
ncbi:MAG: phytanoyl-CoA dioxygenase family protein [bacterium]|nr:phytanoyl-CoA dioxygenase family protein [bacterium]